MLALFLRRVGVDQNRLAIDDLLGQLMCAHDQIDRVLDTCRPQEHRHANIRANFFVEDEVDPAVASHHIEDGTQVRVPEVERDGARL